MVALNQCRCRRSVTDSCRGSFAKRAPRAHHRGLLPLLLVALTATPALAIGKNQGSWGPKIDLPVIPVAAAVTINNKLLMWSAELKDGYASANGTTQTATLDLDTMEVSEAIVSNTGHNMFCPGLAYLFSGTLLVNGGANDYQTSLYDPSSATWSAGAQMNIPRGYPGDCTLSDNRVFTIGGSWSGGTAIKNGEIWSNKTGWQKLTGALVDVMLTDDPEGQFRQDNQPWLFALGRNIVFQAGPSKQMNFFDMSGEGSSRPAGLRGDDGHAMNGFAVMYEPYKILTTGGGPAYSYDDIPATNNAHVITLDEFNVKSVEKVESMKYARAFHNAIILPDGDVLVVGGQSVPRIFADSNAVLVPELWDHKTRTFRTLESDYIPRTYHSTGILLPDGRVFSGGGGLCNPSVQNYCPKNPDGSSATGNHLDGRIFTPPYLLKEDGSPAERPAIVDAPRAALHSAIITVKTDGPVKSFVLIRLGAVTHTMNNDQRRIPLEFALQGDNTYTMKIPSSRGLVISGYYWLFALNADGVPSVAHRIRIEQRDS